ncbi:hypothetical protein AB3540_12395 [Acinetobacter nosocomialis]
MSEQQIQTLWNEFLNQWSVEKVQKMTLPEYSQVVMCAEKTGGFNLVN